MKTETIHIEGMTCGHCVLAVRRALERIPGITINDVTIGSAVVSLDETLVSPRQVEEAIREAGYKTKGNG